MYLQILKVVSSRIFHFFYCLRKKFLRLFLILFDLRSFSVWKPYYLVKEPVAKESVYWNDFILWDTATRYSRCWQKSYSIFFLLFQSVKSFQYKRFIQTTCLDFFALFFGHPRLPGSRQAVRAEIFNFFFSKIFHYFVLVKVQIFQGRSLKSIFER